MSNNIVPLPTSYKPEDKVNDIEALNYSIAQLTEEVTALSVAINTQTKFLKKLAAEQVEIRKKLAPKED
jgi:hypothetical protein